MDTRDYVCIAHDTTSFEEMKYYADLLHPYAATSKLGLEIISSPDIFAQSLAYLKQKERRIFVDLKIHDIPQTVGRAIANLAEQGVHMCTIHGGGPQGIERMRAAVKNKGEMKVFAVTVLTSVERKKDIGMPVTTQVLYTAMHALKTGVDGIICSAQDLDILQRSAADFSPLRKCTPGIRPTGSPSDDQKRTMTPTEAILAGSDMLIVGRPFTDPAYNKGDPARTAQTIYAEVERVRTTD